MTRQNAVRLAAIMLALATPALASDIGILVDTIARQEGISPRMARALVAVESRGRPNAYSKGNPEVWVPLSVIVSNADINGMDVGPQLAIGRHLSACNETLCRAIEPPRGDEQSGSEKSNQRIRDLKPIAKERRPELGSFLAAVLTLYMAFFLGSKGDDLRNKGFRRAGTACLCAGPPLIIYAVIGLLFGLDVWSILRWAY